MLVLFLLAFFIFISYMVYGWLRKINSFLFLVVSAVYLPFTYYFQLFAVRLDNFLIYNNLFVESRHTNYLLVALFFVCIFTVFLTIIAAIAGKENRRTESIGEQITKQHTDIGHRAMPAKYAQQGASL